MINITITGIKNALEGINTRITEAKQVSKLEHKMIKITAKGQNIPKRMKIIEDSFKDF